MSADTPADRPDVQAIRAVLVSEHQRALEFFYPEDGDTYPASVLSEFDALVAELERYRLVPTGTDRPADLADIVLYAMKPGPLAAERRAGKEALAALVAELERLRGTVQQLETERNEARRECGLRKADMDELIPGIAALEAEVESLRGTVTTQQQALDRVLRYLDTGRVEDRELAAKLRAVLVAATEETT